MSNPWQRLSDANPATMAHTGNDANVYIELDLGLEVCVEYVRVNNRNDVRSQRRLWGVSVDLFNANRTLLA